jgi:hypothetical protein
VDAVRPFPGSAVPMPMSRTTLVGFCTLPITLAGFVLSVVLQARPQSSGSAPVAVPFVGCESDGQTGPLQAPGSPSPGVSLAPRLANRLALYEAESGPPVLGPRGWSCFGFYGSGGTYVVITPRPTDMAHAAVTGPAIVASITSGGTSGRFTVAPVVARVFSSERAYLDRIRAEGLVPTEELVSRPFPADHVTRVSDHLVEYVTGRGAKGLGTLFGIIPNTDPISGAAVLVPERDFELRDVAVRLPPAMRDLDRLIIRHFEDGS